MGKGNQGGRRDMKKISNFFDFKLLKFLFIALNLILFALLYLMNFQNQKKIESLEKNNMEKNKIISSLILENKKKNLRIDKLINIVKNNLTIYPAVGESIKKVLIDLKEDNTFDIDQKIADLPEDMRQIIIEKNIRLHGLNKYKIFDTNYIMPVETENGYIPSRWGEFGWRPKLFDEKTYQYIYNSQKRITQWAMHPANDFVHPYSPDIFAVADGIVLDIGESKRAGKYVIIKHKLKDKPVSITRYYHLFDIKVKKKQEVKQGDIIGLIGNTGGASTGTHLHFEYLEFNGKRWIYRNFLEGTTHNRKWMAGCYWYKNYKILEDGTKKSYWKIKVL